MLNLYEVSTSRDMVTNTDNSTTCLSKFEVPSSKANTKNEGPSENMDII